MTQHERRFERTATHFGALLGALFLAASCGSDDEFAPEDGAARPNVLLISIDTLRADHLGCYGYGRPTSPNIDALAERGHVFETALTPMNATLPSHAALFTSQHPVQLGVPRNGRVLNQQVETLAEVLSASGYDTGGFVSATPLNPKFGIDQGFLTYSATERGTQRPAEVTREAARQWLHREREQPFFAFVHFFDPHAMYEAPEEFRQKLGAPPFRHPALRQFPDDLSSYNDGLKHSIIDSYDAEIAYADDQVGKLLADLEEAGVADNTWVIVLSDHGETLGELVECCGFLFAHSEFLSFHELRVPLLFAGPKRLQRSPPARLEEPVSLLDVAPTVLSLVGVRAPGSMTGSSLRPLLSGKDWDPRPLVSVLPENPDPPANDASRGSEIAILDGNWLRIRSEGRGDLLYEIRRGVAHEVEEDAERASELDELLGEWVTGSGEPLYEAHSDGVDPELIQQLRDLGYAVGGDLGGE